MNQSINNQVYAQISQQSYNQIGRKILQQYRAQVRHQFDQQIDNFCEKGFNPLLRIQEHITEAVKNLVYGLDSQPNS